MEEIDIQKERQKTAEARKELKEIQKLLQKTKEKINKVKDEKEQVEEEKNKAEEERNKAEEEKYIALLSLAKDFEYTKDEAVQMLADKCHIATEEAQKKMQQYWNV